MTENKSKLKFVAGVALVFFVGVLSGALGASLYFEARTEKMFHGRPPHGEEIVSRLTQDLNLTPAQQAEIRPIIMAFEKKASALKEQFRPQMKQLRYQVTAQIRTRLNEIQKKTFDEINEKLEKRFRHRPPLPPPPDGARKDPG